MISFLRRHQKSIFAATLTIFFGGMFVGFGGYWFERRDLQGIAARVGDAKIPYSTLMSRVELYANQSREAGKDLDDAQLAEIKKAILNDMMVDELLALKADELGLVVTDEELAQDIRATPAFRRGGQFDQEAYFALIRGRFRITPQEYEHERRKAIKTARLRGLFFRTGKVTAAELREAYAAAHKGALKNFDKDKDAFLMQLQRQHELDMVNRCLQQMQMQVEVQNLLNRAETGV